MKIDPRKPPSPKQGRALKIIGEAVASDPGSEQETLLLVATFAICMIRGTYGQQFAMDFLHGAMDDVTDPHGLRIKLEVKKVTTQ